MDKRERGASRVLGFSGLEWIGGSGVAEQREADPTVERRQPSITMALLGLGVKRAF